MSVRRRGDVGVHEFFVEEPPGEVDSVILIASRCKAS